VLISFEPVQPRRLVINIGGQKFGSQILGGQKFRENIFSDNMLKKFFKKIFLFSKISDDFFLVIENFSQIYTLHSKFTPFFVFFFLCLCFCFFHVYFIK